MKYRFIVAACIVAIWSPVMAQESISGNDMALIPAGEYDMGSAGDAYPQNEMPRHRVRLPAFFIDRNEVTNAQFAAFLNARRPDEKRGGQRWTWIVLRTDLGVEERSAWFPAEIVFADGKYTPVRGFENYPVVAVAWSAADAYCQWAGKRLPTEAEWEKAGRGGIEHADFPWGDSLPTADSGVVFGKKWKDNTMPVPAREVGNYPPNRYGIFDMAGNVGEWCSDWFGPYARSSVKSPRGPGTGSQKVVRGGSWASLPIGTRVAARYALAPEVMSNAVGFRCARNGDGAQDAD